MSILFDILIVFGFALFMLAAGFIRLQVKADLRQAYLQSQTTEECPLNNGDNHGRRQ